VKQMLCSAPVSMHVQGYSHSHNAFAQLSRNRLLTRESGSSQGNHAHPISSMISFLLVRPLSSTPSIIAGLDPPRAFAKPTFITLVYVSWFYLQIIANSPASFLQGKSFFFLLPNSAHFFIVYLGNHHGLAVTLLSWTGHSCRQPRNRSEPPA
jgi:hypothetical protein